jgi:hypothetical protein
MSDEEKLQINQIFAVLIKRITELENQVFPQRGKMVSSEKNLLQKLKIDALNIKLDD